MSLIYYWHSCWARSSDTARVSRCGFIDQLYVRGGFVDEVAIDLCQTHGSSQVVVFGWRVVYIQLILISYCDYVNRHIR